MGEEVRQCRGCSPEKALVEVGVGTRWRGWGGLGGGEAVVVGGGGGAGLGLGRGTVVGVKGRLAEGEEQEGEEVARACDAVGVRGSGWEAGPGPGLGWKWGAWPGAAPVDLGVGGSESARRSRSGAAGPLAGAALAVGRRAGNTASHAAEAVGAVELRGGGPGRAGSSCGPGAGPRAAGVCVRRSGCGARGAPRAVLWVAGRGATARARPAGDSAAVARRRAGAGLLWTARRPMLKPWPGRRLPWRRSLNMSSHISCIRFRRRSAALGLRREQGFKGLRPRRCPWCSYHWSGAGGSSLSTILAPAKQDLP